MPTLTRSEYVASLTDSDVTDVVELPAIEGCLPILSVSGYLFVVELPTDEKANTARTLDRLSPSLERLTTPDYPGVALYAERPEGAELEQDCAERVLGQLTASMEADAVTAGTKTEAIALVRAAGGTFSQRTGRATFLDGSSITFGQVGQIYGPLFIQYADGMTAPVLVGQTILPSTVH